MPHICLIGLRDTKVQSWSFQNRFRRLQRAADVDQRCRRYPAIPAMPADFAQQDDRNFPASGVPAEGQHPQPHPNPWTLHTRTHRTLATNANWFLHHPTGSGLIGSATPATDADAARSGHLPPATQTGHTGPSAPAAAADAAHSSRRPQQTGSPGPAPRAADADATRAKRQAKGCDRMTWEAGGAPPTKTLQSI